MVKALFFASVLFLVVVLSRGVPAAGQNDESPVPQDSETAANELDCQIDGLILIVSDLLAGVDPGYPPEPEDNANSSPPGDSDQPPPSSPQVALQDFFRQEAVAIDSHEFRTLAERAASSELQHAVQLVLERKGSRVATAYIEENSNGGWKMLDFAACYSLIGSDS